MHLYWRIRQDLDCLGEFIRFHDPAMIRSLRKWARKNITGLVLAEGWFQDGIPLTGCN
ncbi:MAG: hypothetical protein ACOCW9_05015 [Thermodesulfobacteriota bacterium]